MKVNLKQHFFAVGAIFIFSALFIGSATTQKINYAITSVAEEGGTQFSQINNPEEENTVGTNVYSTGGSLVWDAAPTIDISPDGEKIAYIQSKNGVDNIYIRSAKGGTAVTQRTFSTVDLFGTSFSHDGKNISFSDKKDNSYNIYQITSSEGASVQQITNTTSNELSPVYSPDDRYIYYTKEETEFVNGIQKSRYFIWSYDKDKSIHTQLIEGYSPSISPDGKNIIYTKSRQKDGKGEIWIMNIESGIPTLLMSSADKGFSTPQISPDGKKVLCVGSTNKSKNSPQNLDIYIFGIDGTGLTELTFNPVHDFSPRWAPNGKEIFFISQRGSKKGKFSIWKMNFNK